MTVTPTPTPALCAGDCSGDGQVEINELVSMVNIALGNVDLSTCAAGDVNGDRMIEINEIIIAVNDALTGCTMEPTPTPTPAFDKTAFSIDDPTSQWVVVNKMRPLDPIDYTPNDLAYVPGNPNPAQLRKDASDAVVEMFAAFEAETGMQMQVLSAFRSYDSQNATYHSWVTLCGQGSADQFSARPGYSEHQTGLAVDIRALPNDCQEQDATCFDDVTCFAATTHAEWLKSNAFNWGFVLRYPPGKTPVTGYEFEPWHYRYVGAALAKEMHRIGATTLEEFFGLPAAPVYLQ